MTDPDVKALARRIYASEERISALARARQLTSSSIPVNIGGEQVDIPLTVGVSQAVKAREELEVAKAELEAALKSARAEIEAAEGRLAETEQKVAVAEQQITEMLVDLDTAMEDAAAAQVEAVLAQGMLTVSASAPTAASGQGKKIGSVWMHRSGAAVIAMYEWTSLGWVTRPLSEQIIPQVAIGAGTYGELDGVRLRSRSVLAEKVLIGGGGNHVDNPTLIGEDGWQLDKRGVALVSDPEGNYFSFTGTGSTGVLNSAILDVEPGDEILFEAEVWSPGFGGNAGGLRGYRYRPDGTSVAFTVANFNPSDTPQKVSASYTIPPGFTGVQYRYATALTSGEVRMRKPRMRRKSSGELLVDGAVGARHVATGTLQTLAATITEAWIQSGHIVNLDVGKLVASSAALSSAVIEKLWADVVKAKFLTVTEKIITQDVIATGAIDGMVITGARVRTAATGQRLELDINGLVAYAPTGASVARLFSGTGGLEISGTLTSVSGSNIQTKDPGSNRTAWLSPSAVVVEQVEGRTSSVGADGLAAFLRSDRAGDGKDRSAGVSPYEASVSRYIDNGPSSPRTQIELLTAGPDRISLSRAPSTSYPINGVEASQFWVRPVSSSNFGSGFELGVEKITSPRGTVEFTSMVKFQGDTDWAEIPLLSGFVVQNSQPLQWRMKQGTLQFRGRIGRADSSPIGGSYVTVTGPSSALGGLVSGAGWSNRPILTPGSDTNKPGLLLVQADGSLRAAIDGIAFFPVAQVLL